MSKKPGPGKRMVRVRSEEMEWLDANKGWLEREHAGDWTAVKGSELIASGPDPVRVFNKAKSQGIGVPFLSVIQSAETRSAIKIRSPRLDRA